MISENFLIHFFLNTETELMSEIEKISEEKHLQSQKILQLEQNIQKSSILLSYTYYTFIL